MFREMRRIEKQTDFETAIQLLDQAQDGVIGMISIDNGYPYTTAVNHIVKNGYIYFHCAKKGHKIDNIMSNPKVSFFAIAGSYVDQPKFTTKFKSVHVFGKAFIVEDSKEFKEVLFDIARKYTGVFVAKAASEIASAIDKTAVVRIEIDDIKGKVSKGYNPKKEMKSL